MAWWVQAVWLFLIALTWITPSLYKMSECNCTQNCNISYIRKQAFGILWTSNINKMVDYTSKVTWDTPALSFCSVLLQLWQLQLQLDLSTYNSLQLCFYICFVGFITSAFTLPQLCTLFTMVLLFHSVMDSTHLCTCIFPNFHAFVLFVIAWGQSFDGIAFYCMSKCCFICT